MHWRNYHICRQCDCIGACTRPGPARTGWTFFFVVSANKSAVCEGRARRQLERACIQRVEGRNRMLVSTLNSLLCIGVNGSDVASFLAHRFAQLWMKRRQCAAADPPRVKQKKRLQFIIRADCVHSLTVRLLGSP